MSRRMGERAASSGAMELDEMSLGCADEAVPERAAAELDTSCEEEGDSRFGGGPESKGRGGVMFRFHREISLKHLKNDLQ